MSRSFTIYTAIDIDGENMLYTGDDLSDAQSAIRDDVESNLSSYNVDIEVEDDGSFSVTFNGEYKIVETIITY